MSHGGVARSIKLATIGLVLIGAATALPVIAATPKYKLQEDAERTFTECLSADAKVRAIDDAAIEKEILEKGLGRELFQRMRDSMVPSLWRANGLESDPTDEAAAIAVVKPLLAEKPDFSDKSGVPIFLLHRQAMAGAVIAKAISSECSIPPHVLPGGDPDREWMYKNEYLIDKASRFSSCVTEAEYKIGIGKITNMLNAAVPQDKNEEIRGFVHQAMVSDEFDDGFLRTVEEAPTVGELLQRYVVVSYTLDDYRPGARASFYYDDRVNRYLRLNCSLEDAVAVRAAFAIPAAD